MALKRLYAPVVSLPESQECPAETDRIMADNDEAVTYLAWTFNTNSIVSIMTETIKFRQVVLARQPKRNCLVLPRI